MTPTHSGLSLSDRAERRGVADLVRGACLLVGITEREWYGARKQRPIPEARAIAWIAMRNRGLSFSEIGWVSGKNHTTIVTACNGGKRPRRVRS